MMRQSAISRAKAKVQDRLAATPPRTWGKAGAGLLLGGLAVGWIAFPYILDKVVAYQINLAKGTDSRRLWVHLPTFDFNMYVFNITNPAEVARGMRPVVQQIGPYCYKEVKDKVDFLEDPASDTISYSARNTWYENQKSPKCAAPHLTGEEIVVVPNIPLLSVLLIAEKDFPTPFMSLVNQALPAIFGKLEDVFIRVPAKKLLFDGIPIDCTASALYPRAVCIAVKQNSRALKKLAENKYSFSFFGAKNNTPEEFRYTVKRGAEEGPEIGQLVALDGRPELPFWRGECNKLQGTDATVFPPFRQKENGSLTAYSSEACRIFSGIFEGEYEYKGVTGYAYALSFGDSENNPKERCFCPADNRCRKKGIIDSFKCQGAPLYASHPHFYDASPDYINGVQGLSPDKEKHGIVVVLEPISGSPLVVRKRLQFNIDLKPMRYVPLTRRLPRVLMPLFWAEEMLDLDANLMGMLEASLFRPIRAVDVIKWMAVVVGITLAATAVVMKIRKDRRDKVHVLKEDFNNGWNNYINRKPEASHAVDKPTDINNNTSNDPFVVSYEESHLKAKEKELKLSAVDLMTTSTLRSHNVGYNSSEARSSDNTKSDLNDDFVIVKSNGNTQSVPNTPSLTSTNVSIKASDTFSSHNSDNAVHLSGRLVSPNQSIYDEIHTPSVNNLDELSDKQSETPQFVNSSLESQASIISSVPPFSKLSPYYPPPSTPKMSNKFQNIQPREWLYDSKIQRNLVGSAPLITKSVTSTELRERDTISFDEDMLFGETTQDCQSNSSNETSIEAAEFSDDIRVSNTSVHSDKLGDTREPSAADLEAAEEDVRKLMLEMAQLIPKNRTNNVNNND